jgi:carboxyl-terminal processing protease
LWAFFLFLFSAAEAAQAESRQALVIANSKYRHVSPLDNPGNDADLLTRVLESVGFKVTTRFDLSRDEMRRVTLEFSRSLRAKNTTGLFFFAGHGVQVDGLNYLLPVEADIEAEAEVPLQAVAVSELLETLEASGSRGDGRLNIIILDACRNNPFTRGWRSAARGLAPIAPPSGTLVAFSTAPGDVALDGPKGSNSPYAKGLAQAILEPGLTVEETFKRTRIHVLEATKTARKQQVPWEQSSLVGSFHFVPDGKSGPVAAVAGPDAVELTFWETVKNSLKRADFEAYLRSYPEGKFRDIAASRLADIPEAPAVAPYRRSPGDDGPAPLVDPSLIDTGPKLPARRHGETIDSSPSDEPRPLVRP